MCNTKDKHEHILDLGQHSRQTCSGNEMSFPHASPVIPMKHLPVSFGTRLLLEIQPYASSSNPRLFFQTLIGLLQRRMVHGDTMTTVRLKSDNYMYFSFGLAGGRCQIISSVIITLNMEILK